MKKKLFMISVLALLCSTVAFAQENATTKADKKKEKKEKTEEEKKKESKFSIAPTVTIFTKYGHGLADQKEEGGFALDRAYLGAKFKYGNTLSGKVVLDFGSTKIDNSALDLVAYVKNACVSWKKSGFEVNFGLITTNNFTFQQSFWGYRYVAKSYVDMNGFAPSADLGVSAAYKYKWFAVDLQFTNGEGYKKIVLDDDYRYGLGLTFEPVKNFFIRGYYDLFTSKEEGAPVLQTTSVFAGYKHEYFSLGGEYNCQFNKSFTSNNNLMGFSFYATGYILDQLEVYARYDQTFAEFESDKKEGATVIAGIEYTPFKCLKISPNVSYFNPTASDIDELFVNLSVQFKL